jgi:hypothetical protein
MTVKEAIEVLQQMNSNTQVKLVFTDKSQSASNDTPKDYGQFGESYSMSRPYQ